MNDLNIVLHDNPFDLVCISEHWLEDSSLKLIKIDNYALVASYCRQKNIFHGGVAIFSQNNIISKAINLEAYSVPVHAEFCGAEVSPKKVFVLAVYRSSSYGDLAVFKVRFQNVIEYITRKYREVVIVGDINIDLNGNTEHAIDIRNMCASYGIKHYIHEPTRITPTISSCLDNVLSNICSSSLLTGTFDPHISDHLGVYLIINKLCDNVCENLYFRRLITKNRIDKFTQKLINFDWSNLSLIDKCSNECTKLILDQLNYFVNICFPMTSEKCKSKRIVWFNQRLKDMRGKLNEQKRKFNNSNANEDWISYNVIRKEYRKALKQEKRNKFSNVINNADNKSKMAWKLVNNEINTQKKLILRRIYTVMILIHIL